MASSLKAVLRKKANQDGTFPLAIRVTVDRRILRLLTLLCL